MPVKSGYRSDENLSGYTTFVTDKSKKGLPTDIDRETESALPGGAATPGSARKEDTADGNGRSIGKPSYNTPGTGEDGPAENPRTLPTPGEQEGNPTKFDYGMPTRRSMTAYHPRMPWHKEHRQGPQDKRDDKKYYRENKGKIKRRVKMWYRKVRHDHRLKVIHKKREEKPKKYVRTKSPLVEKPRSHEKKTAYDAWSPGQRRHKRVGPEHRARHRDYMHNRSRSLRQHQRWYTRNHNKPAFKRRQRLRQEHPSRYKMRFGAFAPAESIHFVFGPTMVQGQVDSVSLDTIAFSAVGTDEVLYLTPAAFLHAVVFLTPEDANSMFEVLDDEVGFEAFADLTSEDVQAVARLYGVMVPDVLLGDPDALHAQAVSIVESAMEGWDRSDMGSRVASTYLRAMNTFQYDQESPDSGSWEKPDLEHKTPYKQDGPDQYRWDPGEKAPDPGTGGGMPSIDTTGFGGGSGKVIPDSMKYATGGCSTTETSYAWIAPDGDVHECHPLDHTDWAKKYVFEQKLISAPQFQTWQRVDVIAAIKILFAAGWIRVSNFVSFEADKALPSAAWESAAKMVVKCVSHFTADKIISVYQRSPWDVKDFEVGDFVQKFGGRRLADEMFEKLNRTASVGPPCSPYTVSTAWVAPDGTYHDLHEGHRRFAERWLVANGGIDMDSEPEEQMIAIGWVKASNHFSFFAQSLVPSRALEVLAKKAAECVQKDPNLLEEEVLLFIGAEEQIRHDFKVTDFVQKYGGRKLADSLFTNRIATGNPCEVTNVSVAWISPEGQYIELKHDWHFSFAQKWLKAQGITADEGVDADDQLVLLGWIKVSNQFSFLAKSSAPSQAWEIAASKTADCIRKDEQGRLDAPVLVFIYVTPYTSQRHEFKVDEFVAKYAGRKVAEKMYEGRVAALTRSPCNHFESFAWIDPKGGYHILKGKSHMEWACAYLRKKGARPEHESLVQEMEQAHQQLLEEGWVRVVSAQAFQAIDLDRHPIQAEKVLEVLLRGVQDGCVKPDSKVWLMTGFLWGRNENQYTAADFANWLGGKSAEEQVYGMAMTKMAGACPIKTELYGGLPSSGGFDTIKEIGVGLANTFEAAHCVLGSLGRQQDWYSMRKTESGHISEEIGIIFRNIEEYSQQLYIDQMFDFSDYKPEWQERARQSAQKQVDDLLVSAPRLKGLATQKRDALEDLPQPVYDLAFSTYQLVIALCDACLEGVKGWPVSMKNPFKDATMKKWAGQMKKDFAAIRAWEPSTDGTMWAKTADFLIDTMPEVRGFIDPYGNHIRIHSKHHTPWADSYCEEKGIAVPKNTNSLEYLLTQKWVRVMAFTDMESAEGVTLTPATKKSMTDMVVHYLERVPGREFDDYFGDGPPLIRCYPLWSYTPIDFLKIFADRHTLDQMFEGRYAHTKTAMTLGEIEDKTLPEVRDRAGSVQVSLARADKRNGIWTFKAAGSKGESYLIRVKAEPHGNTKEVGKLQVKVSCTCNFFRWQGPEHHAKLNGYLYGQPRGTASEPVIKDPTKVHYACKHIIAVLTQHVKKYRIASESLWPADAEVTLDFGVNASRVAERYGDPS